MIYNDEKLYVQLFQLLRICNAEIISYCPYCGYDIRRQYDCENCDIDHMDMGGKCNHDGKHSDNCLLIKHITLLEIDLDIEKAKNKEVKS